MSHPHLCDMNRALGFPDLTDTHLDWTRHGGAFRGGAPTRRRCARGGGWRPPGRGGPPARGRGGEGRGDGGGGAAGAELVARLRNWFGAFVFELGGFGSGSRFAKSGEREEERGLKRCGGEEKKWG
ncbi:hypothetical protein PAHAL_1G267900 [Panicum hallii]|uniref:Uncharacterized protein n=1 Tax=Panicum hallii TaxID=206008 RepID=A0A2T8KWF3_9POAL|nr:hypothetical protein PAHAL_1G267900 [Panicum hallii]